MERKVNKSQATWLRSLGWQDAEIAREMGVSRQAIHDALGPRKLDRTVVERERRELGALRQRLLDQMQVHNSVKRAAQAVGVSWGKAMKVLEAGRAEP